MDADTGVIIQDVFNLPLHFVFKLHGAVPHTASSEAQDRFGGRVIHGLAVP
ncbi:hypothetical protein FQZ97_1253950 [compost metagenome]